MHAICRFLRNLMQLHQFSEYKNVLHDKRWISTEGKLQLEGLNMDQRRN